MSKPDKPFKNKTTKNLTTLELHLSEKEEEILEYIGKTNENAPDQGIKRINLANILNCSPALINKLLKKLESKGLIIHKRYGEITLTKRGLKSANALIRKHRLSEALFVNLLGLDPSEAHEFACKFEHILDDKLANRIDNVLKYPKFCPHGHSIEPTATQNEIKESLSLTKFNVNDILQVSQIKKEESNFLRKLAQTGIEVGVKIRVLEKSPLDETLLIEIDGKTIPLGKDTADNLWGILLDNHEE